MHSLKWLLPNLAHWSRLTMYTNWPNFMRMALFCRPWMVKTSFLPHFQLWHLVVAPPSVIETKLNVDAQIQTFPCPTILQDALLSPSDHAMRLVSSNLANYHATVHKLLIRQVLTKLVVWSWRFSRRQCVIDNVHSTMTQPSRFHCLRCVINEPTTDDLWISPVYQTTCCGEIY